MGKKLYRLMILILLILATSCVIYAKEKLISYKDFSEIKDTIKENDNEIPLYSVKKESNKFNVVYKQQTESKNIKSKFTNDKYNKKIERFYSEFDLVQKDYKYKEYDSEKNCWYEGNLGFVSVEKNKHGYTAIYSGILYYSNKLN